MWRPVRVLSRSCIRLHKTDCPKCSFATAPQQSSGGKGVIILTSASLLGIGGTLAYAKYNPKFGKVLEENIPYVDVILKNLPSFESDDKVPPKDPAAMKESVKEKAIDSGLLKKKQDRLKQELKSVVEMEPTDVSRTVGKKADTGQVKSQQTEPVSKQPSKQVVSDVSADKKQELETLRLNAQMERSIKELIERVNRLSKEAVKAQETAAFAIQRHASALYFALDSSEINNENELWNQAHTANTNRIKAVNSANKLKSEVQAVMEELRREKLKIPQSSLSAKPPIIITVEETLTTIGQQLENSTLHMAAAEADAKIASDYKELVDEGKEQFMKELEAVLPKDRLGDSKHLKDLSEEEVSLLIAHAHKKIEQLQKQFAKQKVTEIQRIRDAVKLQRFEDEKIVDSRISLEMEKQRQEVEASFQKRLSKLQEEFEAEMRLQLRRQAAAHSDHIKEALHVQQEELHQKYKIDTESKLLHQRGVFISKLSESMARLASIEGYLKARSEFDKETRKAQSLWLACQAMKHTIKRSSCGNPNTISKELAAIKDASGDDNQYVSVLLAGLPAQAVERGVYSEELLKQRFQKVNKICCQVALIDNGGSLFRYVLSYLQSFLICEAKSIPKAELDGKVAVDPSEWDTFDILGRVNFSLQRDDLEQALRYANQLTGEPKNVAKDWIAELRLLLETKQVADALTAHAVAVGVQAYH